MINLPELLQSGLRLTLPLFFAAFGGMFSERSGVANIALEAQLLVSGFAGAASMALTHSLPLSLFIALAASLLATMLFGFFTITAKADQIIAGMALNLLATGLIPVLSNGFFDVSGQTPALQVSERLTDARVFFAIAIGIFLFTVFFFKKTKWGLRVRAAGENPQSLRTQGVSVEKTRYIALALSSFMTAWGGIFLSLGEGSNYTRNMSAGRGYIALAALIFGGWRPLPTLTGCLIFGMADALQISLQSVPLLPGGKVFPVQALQVLPYATTVAVLLVLKKTQTHVPKAINQPLM